VLLVDVSVEILYVGAVRFVLAPVRLKHVHFPIRFFDESHGPTPVDLGLVEIAVELVSTERDCFQNLRPLLGDSQHSAVPAKLGHAISDLGLGAIQLRPASELGLKLRKYFIFQTHPPLPNVAD